MRALAAPRCGDALMATRARQARREHGSPAPAPASPERHRLGPLSSRRVFLTRVRRAATYAFGLIAATLLLGMVGYHALEDLSWLDAFHQASLLLSGMGPVVDVHTTAGKVFDSVYALFCGVVLLASTGLLFAPILHRILHRFHVEDSGDR
jgi:hypothetical protein